MEMQKSKSRNRGEAWRLFYKIISVVSIVIESIICNDLLHLSGNISLDAVAQRLRFMASISTSQKFLQG
jgi:hypothetical protein